MRALYFLFVIALCAGPPVKAQSGNVLNTDPPTPTFGNIARHQALAATDSVFSWIERRHPAPYQHRSRANIRRDRLALRRSLPDSVDRWWLGDQLARMVATLDLESVWILNASSVHAPPSVLDPQRMGSLPGAIEWIEDKPVVTYGRRGLWLGDRLLRINEIDVDSFVKHAAPAYSGTTQHRLYFAALQLAPELFRRGLLNRDYRIDVQRWNGELVSLRILPSTAFERVHDAELRREDFESVGIGTFIEMRDRRVIVRNIGGLVLDSARAPAYLRQIANKLTTQKATAFIIDLRWEGNMPPWLVQRVLNALKPTGMFGKTRVPVCVLQGAMTSSGAARLVAEVQRLGLARTLGEDAGARRGALSSDDGHAVPHLSAILMLPEREQPVQSAAPRTLHPLIHVPVWRHDVAIGRDLAMEVAGECGSLKPIPTH